LKKAPHYFLKILKCLKSDPGHFGRRGRQSHLCLAPGRVGRAGAFAAPVPQRGAARGLRGARGGTLDSRRPAGELQQVSSEIYSDSMGIYSDSMGFYCDSIAFFSD
jgi:hypothetical protein